MGERVVHLMIGRIIDFLEFHEGFAIAKTRIAAAFVAKTLADCALRTRYGITAVGVKRSDKAFTYATPTRGSKPAI